MNIYVQRHSNENRTFSYLGNCILVKMWYVLVGTLHFLTFPCVSYRLGTALFEKASKS